MSHPPPPRQTTSYSNGVRIDCKMGDPRSFTPRITRTTTRSVIVSADDVFASLDLRVVAGAPRLVVCVLVEIPAHERADGALATSSVTGYPATFDATTGAPLALHPAGCLL